MLKNNYVAHYNKENYYSFLLRIPKKSEEIIKKMESVPSKNNYILNLINEDISSSVLKLSFIKKVLKEVFKKFQIEKIYLFGSYARGEANKDSDIDILCEKGNISTLLEKIALEDELEQKLGKKVDLIFLDSTMSDYFKIKIQEDLIALC